MVSAISLDDRNAWDDSALIDSWDEALAEYKKYYSIQAQGKRLEDALSEEELKELKEEHGDLIEGAETKSSIADANNHAGEVSPEHSNGDQAVQADQVMAQAEEPTASEKQSQPNTADAVAEAMPQAILGTVQDENLKNLMMSWYYAGYYTGLHAQQKKT